MRYMPAMPPPLLTLDAIRLTFGGAPLFDGASLNIEPGARIALVGRNGSGKSTLLKIAAGLVEPDAGARFADPSATIAYLPQEPDFSGFETAGAFVEASLPPAAAARLPRLYDELGLDPASPCASLSGGEARRAALIRAFAGDPDVLLLDEPTNHLDLPATLALEERLAASRAAIVLISHDRRFLETLSRRTVWIDRARTRDLDRGFADFEAWRDKQLEDEEAAAHKLDRKILAEEHWVRYGVTARRKRNVRRMRELGDLRKARAEWKMAPGMVSFSANAAGPSGKRVIVAEKISKSFGGRAVVRDFSIEIARGDRIGVVGPNGAGKTTLLRMLTGDLAPDSGSVALGSGLERVTLDQNRASLNPETRVADAITGGRGDFVTIGAERRHVASYLKDFLFKPEQWRTPVAALSGGEKGRLALAAALAKSSNLLVLDEPTNDLDLETLDLLEELVADYKGTLLIVSHDRSFLDRAVTAIVTTDPSGREGQWTDYAGGYTDMLAQRGRAPGSLSSPPPRSEGGVGKADGGGALRESRLRGWSARPQSLRDSSPVKNGGAKSAPTKAKLTFNEKFALETLPAQIDALTSEIAALKAALADPSLFARDAAAFNRQAARLEAAEFDLAAAEDEWLTVAMKT